MNLWNRLQEVQRKVDGGLVPRSGARHPRSRLPTARAAQEEAAAEGEEEAAAEEELEEVPAEGEEAVGRDDAEAPAEELGGAEERAGAEAETTSEIRVENPLTVSLPFDELVEMVKEGDAGAWREFCERSLGGRDPTEYPTHYLEAFLAGEGPPAPGGPDEDLRGLSTEELVRLCRAVVKEGAPPMNGSRGWDPQRYQRDELLDYLQAVRGKKPGKAGPQGSQGPRQLNGR